MTKSLVIDLRFAGVGRICLASKTANPVVKAKYERMLKALYDDGRLDILRAIRDRLLKIPEAYDAYRRGALNELSTGETARQLGTAWAAWVRASDASDKHKISLTMSGRYLQRSEGRARVADLPRLLRKLWETLGANHPRSYNLLRSAASAFVRDTLGKAHQIYSLVTATPTRTVKTKRKGRPLTPEQMKNYFGFEPRDEIGRIAWSMATTGMGQKELWGEWAANPTLGHVYIEGTKRDGRVRDVPLFWRPFKPTIHRQTFEKKFRERTKRAFQPYDLRRAYANWLELAGIPRTRRRLYMGHGAQNVTDLYEYHEVRRFLIEDGQKLAAILPARSVESSVVLSMKRKKGA